MITPEIDFASNGVQIRQVEMKKIVFGLFMMLTGFIPAFGQFDAQTSQYMLHPAGFNPAAVGEESMFNVSGQHRLNWIGMPNGGSTTIFNLNSPLKFAGSRQGIGIGFINDKVGQFTNQGAHLQIAIKKKLGKGTLSIGTNIGFTSIGFNGDSVAAHPITIGDYHDLTADPEIPSSAVAGMSFDFGAGLWYSTKKIYAGISATHINQPVISWGEKTEFSPANTVYLTTGYQGKTENPAWTYRPSVMIKSDLISWQAEVSMLGFYKDLYWGGLSYRYGDAAVILAGMNIAGGLSIGYSYDIPTTLMITASSGSHEVFLNYSFEIATKKDNLKFKSIRIL